MNLEDIADVNAYFALIGVALETPYGAQLADVHGVRPEHFAAVPHLVPVFAAAVERVEREDLAARLEAISVVTGTTVEVLTDIVNRPRKSYRDTSGAFARRVLASAERFERYLAAAAELDAIRTAV